MSGQIEDVKMSFSEFSRIWHYEKKYWISTKLCHLILLFLFFLSTKKTSAIDSPLLLIFKMWYIHLYIYMQMFVEGSGQEQRCL